jgi:hypothetical protein
MNEDTPRVQTVTGRPLAWLAAGALLLAACSGTRSSAPGAPTGVATASPPTQASIPLTCPPAPAPAGSIAGCWSGTFDTSDPADCHTNTPAVAVFTQDGAHVTGTLSAENACGLDGLAFDGTRSDDTLEGTLTRSEGAYRFQGRATGTIFGDKLEITTPNLDGLHGMTPNGWMHLHR